MNTDWRRVDEPSRLLHHDASSATLIFVLKFMFTMWLVRYAFDPLSQLSFLPIAYTNPVGWLNWLPLSLYQALFSFSGLLLLHSSILISCALVWLPKFRLPGALLGCVLITTASAVTRSFGHINHAEIGPLLVTWIITIFALRLPIEVVRKPTNEQHCTASAGMVLATLVLMLVYAFVGIARLGNGGIDVMAGDSITNRLVHMAHRDWLFDYNFSNWVVSQPWKLLILKLGMAVVTVMEIAAPFSLINDRIRKLTLVLMPAFHFGVILLFKVVFIEQMLTLILLVNLTPCLTRFSVSSLREKVAPRRRWWPHRTRTAC